MHVQGATTSDTNSKFLGYSTGRGTKDDNNDDSPKKDDTISATPTKKQQNS